MNANDLKRTLKQSGLETKKIRINRNTSGVSTAFLVKILDKNIDSYAVSKVLAPMQKIRRCETTGDILNGGNVFILVQKV